MTGTAVQRGVDMAKAALAWYDAGCCVVRARADGTKAPLGKWLPYQSVRPDRGTVERWFAHGHPGVGVVCGEVSGALEMLEFEGRAIAEGIADKFLDLIVAAGLVDLWQRVLDGYSEDTPSGGLHILYRIDGQVPGNTKLASRPATAEELAASPTEKTKTLIETRGEGGFVIVAPSHGPVHPTERPWSNGGDPAAIPVVTTAEREALAGIARTLDAVPAKVTPTLLSTTQPTRPRTGRGTDEGTPPGDDFEQHSTWPELLEPAGWTRVYASGGTTYWRRPGKATGISATTGRAADRDRLYVFTTSSVFDAETPYTRFGAYAVLHHRGDYSAAAKALRANGYGSRPTPSTQPPQAAPARVEADARLEPEKWGPTEDGLARALVAVHGHELRYCPQRGRWLTWTGHRWEWDEREQHREFIRGMARRLPTKDRWARFRDRALSAAGTAGVARLARSDPAVTVHIDDLDAAPYELNTPSGVVNLRTGAITAPDSTRLHTRCTNVSPDPDADTSRWQAFLADTFGDPTLIAYLQRLVGYSATGRVAAHVLPFAFGSGGNGKGVFLEALGAVLGDYATSAPSGFLMARAFPGHDTEIARLKGARMVVCSEVNDTDRFDEAKVKLLTGGDTLTARFMRQDHFTFTPSHTLWLVGNHRPGVKAGGHSFWRRLRLIPFEHEVAPEAMVDDLQGILATDHGPALLSWLIAGAAAYTAQGLSEPASVLAATAAYEHDQDTVSRFVESSCHFGPPEQIRTTVGVIRDAYETWCHAEGDTPVSAKTLTQTLRRLGATEQRTGRARFYGGLALLTDGEPSHPSEASR